MPRERVSRKVVVISAFLVLLGLLAWAVVVFMSDNQSRIKNIKPRPKPEALYAIERMVGGRKTYSDE
jgi:hypothetical protein